MDVPQVVVSGIPVKMTKAGATQADLEKIVGAAKFQKWFAKVTEAHGVIYRINNMEIRDADWFGPVNLGFFQG